jgi:hypothetical protein
MKLTKVFGGAAGVERAASGVEEGRKYATVSDMTD